MMASQASPEQQKPQSDEVYRFPLGIFLLLGALGGALLVLIQMSGVFDEWQPLNPPPSRPAAFAGVSVYFYQADPYIRAENGVTYFCEIQGAGTGGSYQAVCAWSAQPVSQDAIQENCRMGGVKFWGWKKPFTQAVDCTEAAMAGEFSGAPQVTYVIDSEGELWYWSQENRGNLIFYLPGALLLGLLLGFLASVIWNPLMAFFGKAETGRLAALRGWEAKTLRLGGRLGSIPSLIYFAALVLINARFLIPDNFKGVLLAFALIGGVLGLIAAWRCEIADGALVLLASLAALVYYLAGTSLTADVNLLGVFLYWVPYLPGLFLLLAGILSRKERNHEESLERPT